MGRFAYVVFAMASLLLQWRLAPWAWTDGSQFYGAVSFESTTSRRPASPSRSAQNAAAGVARNLYHRHVQDLPSFRINEIFLSVQGEGLHVGERTVFVRFYGCVLRCVWCDQPEALTHTGVGEYVHLSPEAVRDRVVAYPSTRRVCLTGGEPVIAPTPGLLWLVRELKNSGYW